jgi:hypothetical protein
MQRRTVIVITLAALTLSSPWLRASDELYQRLERIFDSQAFTNSAMEQNRAKNSRRAKLAREGHAIAWEFENRERGGLIGFMVVWDRHAHPALGHRRIYDDKRIDGRPSSECSQTPVPSRGECRGGTKELSHENHRVHSGLQLRCPGPAAHTAAMEAD